MNEFKTTKEEKEEIENKFRRGENVTASELLECFRKPVNSLEYELSVLREKKQKANPEKMPFGEYLALTEEIAYLEWKHSARSTIPF